MKKVRIKHDLMYIDKADNLKANTVHNVVDPPEGYDGGVWVLGVDNAPVKLIKDEFEFVKE